MSVDKRYAVYIPLIKGLTIKNHGTRNHQNIVKAKITLIENLNFYEIWFIAQF